MKILPNEAIQRLSSESVRRAPGAPGVSSAKTTPVEFVRAMGIEDSVYLCRRGNEALVLPCSDRVNPLIGESEEADLTIEASPAFNEWIEDYAKELDWYENIGHRFDGLVFDDLVNEDGEVEATDTDVPILIKTKWNQGSPYNRNLNIDGKLCYAGCLPTAMAQIIYYWYQKGFPRGCVATPEYTTRTNKSKIPALNPIPRFDYENMTLKKPTKEENIKAIADFLEHVGKIVKADYRPSGTGAYPSDAATMFATAFGLGEGIKLIKANSIGLSKFCTNIKTELSKGRPVLVCGYNSSNSGGHAFVCDGYRVSDDKYHFNWGWGGSYDGYFSMSALNPSSSYNFSYNKRAVINVEPTYMDYDVNKDGKIDVTDVMAAVNNILEGKYLLSSDPNYDGKVTITDVQLIVNKILGL